ncbi:VPLPA-CTERM sorting domain-containing protein [Epibacterium sp. SM1969]|uniref:VPLPA-CTERM sorting domain-containing protein n=1 Tax=Tritonibacter aquimaris TaxID=2663379 RepID=A0A844AK85_9RHOB|nr:VPLPA-CTERM sorting domain-containing protein [Tritonibacter aquimaris]MQY41665.1 VPLPA-CTERM sorting domain-containing protein [Tritonibacter aquimaris]
MKTIATAAFLFAAASAAQAATLNFGPGSTDVLGRGIDFNISVPPTTTTSDAVLSLTVRGDFNGFHEYLDITVDGLGLGRIFDGIEANDSFNFSNDHAHSDNSQSQTGSATIANASFANMISDGQLYLLFNPNDAVDYISHISGTITFDTASVAAVPLPASAGLLGLGVFGLGALRRRKQRS